MTQLVVPHMARQKSGTVVNIGSVVGYVGIPWGAGERWDWGCLPPPSLVLPVLLGPRSLCHTMRGTPGAAGAPKQLPISSHRG
jgi:NAD(P)-dependent dehydrogenase (short-subunit alcohol dehydrogenase family)